MKNRSSILIHGFFDEDVYTVLTELSFEKIFILEGRPNFETSKVLAKELIKRGLKPTLISDNMAGFLFARDVLKEVWISYQATNDEGVLSVIGSLILAVLGKKHNVPVKVFPASRTIPFKGKVRDLHFFNGVKVAPEDVKAYIPLAEWVPKKYLTMVHPAFELV